MSLIWKEGRTDEKFLFSFSHIKSDFPAQTIIEKNNWFVFYWQCCHFYLPKKSRLKNEEESKKKFFSKKCKTKFQIKKTDKIWLQRTLLHGKIVWKIMNSWNRE